MIYLGADHGGFYLKEKVKLWLSEWGYKWEDMGNKVFDKDDDYPKFAVKVAESVARDLKSSGSGETFFGDVRRPSSDSTSSDPSSLYEALPPEGNKDSKVSKRQVFKTPQKAHPSPENISWKMQSKGILACRSAAGMVIAANKVKGVRAAAAFDTNSARHSRTNNDANVLALSGDWLDEKKAKEVLKVWLTTEFSKEERHMRRLRQLKEMEERESIG